MESSESVLELLQSAFLLSNALIKRDHLSWSKKGEKKSHAGISTARRKPPEGPYIRNIENGDGGLNRPQMTMETDMTEACRKMHR